MYIFGYGSLMNQNSLQKTLPQKTSTRYGTLLGFKRCFTVLIDNYLYLSLKTAPKSLVLGVLIPINKKELAILKRRETGYRCVNVTKKIKEKVNGEVFTFIGPAVFCPDFSILKSYIQTCLKNAPSDVLTNWQEQTIIGNPIVNDLKNPKYKNFDI